MKSILRVSLSAMAVMGVLASASAQAQTREEIQRDLLDPSLQAEGDPVAVEGAVAGPPCPLAGPEFADLKFTFTGANFSGLDAIDAGMVTPSYADLVGNELSVSAICDIRDRASDILRDAGYLAVVRVPVQEIEDGQVDFDVVLARMTSVQIRGDAGRSSSALQNYVNRLTEEPVFNVKQAERYLLLARDIPGLDVRLVMQPAPRESGAQPGDVVGIFNVVRDPVQFDATAQNFGSQSVGRFGAFGRVRLNGLTGLADQTTISLYSTVDIEEQNVVQVGHEMRLGSDGLTLGGNVTFAWSTPDVVGDDLFDSETLIGTIYAAYPFVRTQTANLYGRFGFELVDQNVDFSGLPLSEDNVRVAFARVEFNSVDAASLAGVDGYSSVEPKYGLAGAVELRQGIGALGASEGCGVGFVNCLAPGVVPPSRLDADPTGFAVRGELQIDYRPSPQILMRLRPRFQYSPDALVSYEQLSGGNYTSGRGFDPGAVIGDSGYGGQVEFAYGSLIPEVPGGKAFQPYVFFDLMSVSTKNVAGTQQITSVGGGLRATLGRSIYLDVFGAVPLERAPFQTERGDVRLLATLSVQL
ncbi:ShlB/FhaC/HecB family hemolysin secretion/activation protein [Erythrobacter sp. F6033]|uniref:ShlB/FhaC/HecB family hemolysin secretion/activation protein n=1 Tax=Erythrobacter sp. F6033 TaxID=2926401 RepID=UPI001FF17DDD|nr:ShlB/FhaC/HecB family hemolysin secretion/activation protein [Erythrobacter sp. F6033]MCK0127894.1 ShlB/FhaC/HecB family hemolysin secretion/activation protein [Erythrobacter sp. F6033]